MPSSITVRRPDATYGTDSYFLPANAQATAGRKGEATPTPKPGGNSNPLSPLPVQHEPSPEPTPGIRPSQEAASIAPPSAIATEPTPEPFPAMLREQRRQQARWLWDGISW